MRRSGGSGPTRLIRHTLKLTFETNPIPGLEVTDESVQDDQIFVPLLDQVQAARRREHPVHMHRVPVMGPMTETSIQYPRRTGVLSRDQDPTDAATHPDRSSYRAECVREKNRLGGYQMWSQEVGYGKR